MASTTASLNLVTGGRSGQVASEAELYTEKYYARTNSAPDKQGEKEKESERERKANYDDVVRRYYDQATDFYEYGWGQSFHFAPIRQGEEYRRSLERHQHRIALKIKADTGMKILDVGCGVGGPGREIAELSGANIVGINISAYQVQRCKKLSEEQKLSRQCTYVEGDFHKMPFEDNSFDCAYSIEATCHSPELCKVYSEVYRVIKPGGYFAWYEWIVSDIYDSSNKVHYSILHNLFEGNGLPNLSTRQQVIDSAKKAGLDVLSAEDLIHSSTLPWYTPLAGGKGISQNLLRSTSIGRKMTRAMLVGMETFGAAPKGVSTTHDMLCRGADALVAAGKANLFSPMLLCVARKPVTAVSE